MTAASRVAGGMTAKQPDGLSATFVPVNATLVTATVVSALSVKTVMGRCC